MKVRYSYLAQQFADPTEILEGIRQVVLRGDFTLGREVAEFERRFSDLIGVKHAIGVNSGTDALKLPLKALGLGPGDEVITTANTFIATVGAINEVGARPVFVDCNDSFVMDVGQVEAAITDRTKAIMPVQFTGEVVDMAALMDIANRHGIPVVEDACQSILGEWDGKRGGTWGIAGGFSLHPLKNLNVWGDSGIIVTNDDEMADKLRLLRNHGLANRDEVEILGYNSRLDTVQAVVGNWLIGQTNDITARRIENGAWYDAAFATLPQVRVPPRPARCRRVFHLYMIFAQDRDGLYEHCKAAGVSAKIHYPTPIYRHPGLARFGYTEGDFPMADRHGASVISFPVDQHISREEQQFVVDTVHDFYQGR